MFDPSLPGLTRRSIPLRNNSILEGMDARIKSAHDIGVCGGAGVTSGKPSMTLK
jgi:hypothetical protein